MYDKRQTIHINVTLIYCTLYYQSVLVWVCGILKRNNKLGECVPCGNPTKVQAVAAMGSQPLSFLD